MADDADEERKFDELRMLYTACVSEIASFKQHQWQVTNYGLLLYAAIVSLPRIVGPGALGKCEYIVLHAALVVVLVAGWLIVGMFADSIQTRRRRLTEIRRHFTDSFKAAWRGGRSESEVPDHPDFKNNLVWFFRAVFVFGFIVATWLLYRTAP